MNVHITIAIAVACVLIAAPQSPPPKTASGPVTAMLGNYICGRDRICEINEQNVILRSIQIPRMERVFALARIDDDRIAAAGGIVGKSGDVAIIDLKQWSVVSQPPAPLFKDAAVSIVYKKNAKTVGRLAAASSDKTALLFNNIALNNFESDKINWDSGVRLEGHTGPVLTIDMNDAFVATGSHDRTIRVWNGATGALERTLTNHGGAVNAAVFSDDGTKLISGSDDGTVRVWDPANGRMIRIIRDLGGKIISLTIVPNAWSGAASAHALTGASDGTVNEIDLDEGVFYRKRVQFTGEWPYLVVPNLSVMGACNVGTDRGLYRVIPGH
ncbi:MAG: hypothetical protein HY286_05440 [Planctomycetes bacterium]|nr:hypothetical protein [Planctomycetota bacterium]